MRFSIFALIVFSCFSVAQADFSYSPSLINERDKTAIYSIEALIEKNCPTAKKLNLVGTSFESIPQHGGFGSVYTVTYGVQLSVAFIPEILTIRSQWEDNFGGKTIPFKVLLDTFLICE